MPEVSVFDAYRASRALAGHLAEGDELRVLATDDVTRNYWCLTKLELFVLKGDDIVARLPFERMHGEVRPTQNGIEVRVTDTKGGGPVLIASFRRANKVTRQLAEMLGGAPAP